MPGGTRTITLTPGFNVTREAITGTSLVDYDSPGNFHAFGKSARPAHRFTVAIPALTQLQVESLQAFHFFHQGGRAFFFNGCNWNVVNTPNLVGEGDGTRTQYVLPNRNVDANSITVTIYDGVTYSVTTAYSLNPTPGIVTFDTAPDSGDDILAAHAHNYLVMFEPDGIRVTNWALGVYRAELVLREII